MSRTWSTDKQGRQTRLVEKKDGKLVVSTIFPSETARNMAKALNRAYRLGEEDQRDRDREDRRVNNFTNGATSAIAIYLNNTREWAPLVKEIREAASREKNPQRVADWMKEVVLAALEVEKVTDDLPGPLGMILDRALSEINWDNLAEHYMNLNAADNPACPGCGSTEPDCEPGCPAVPDRQYGSQFTDAERSRTITPPSDYEVWPPEHEQTADIAEAVRQHHAHIAAHEAGSDTLIPRSDCPECQNQL